MNNSKPQNSFSLGVFLIAFLIGGTFVYFAPSVLPESVAHLLQHKHEHDEAHEHEHEHEHDETHEHDEAHEHEYEHDEAHEHIHGDNDALALNLQALKNIGIEPGEKGMLTLEPVEYQKSFSFPGFVRYKPGRSLISVPSPASGVVTRIFAEEGEALCPGEPLFEIQLTHEELTSCQLELLSLLRKRDLLLSEQDRLGRLATGIEPKTQREIELQMKENEAAIEVQKNALMLLGVTAEILNETLIQKRNLLTSLIVRVPEQENKNSEIVFGANDLHPTHDKEHFLQVEHYQQLEKINVEKGQTVFLGASLCIVSDLHELWIEGKAFESDEARINSAYSNNAEVTAVFSNQDAQDPDIISGLSIRSVSNRLDPTSRTFACFIDLKNYLLDTPSSESPNLNSESAPLLNWRFKPGQRCELEITSDIIENVFVVPVSAVAQDGAESILFEYIGEEDEKPIWHKRSVVVLYQNSREVVIVNDGSIKSGAKIAKTGAYQLYAALTNGGGKLQSACPCGDHEH